MWLVPVGGWAVSDLLLLQTLLHVNTPVLKSFHSRTLISVGQIPRSGIGSTMKSACNFRRYRLRGAVPICLLTSLFPHHLVSVLPNFWVGCLIRFSYYEWSDHFLHIFRNRVYYLFCRLPTHLLCPFPMGFEYWSFHDPFGGNTL